MLMPNGFVRVLLHAQYQMSSRRLIKFHHVKHKIENTNRLNNENKKRELKLNNKILLYYG